MLIKISTASEVAEKMSADFVDRVEISVEATIQLLDGSLRDPVGKSPLVKIGFRSGDVIIAEIAS